LSTYWITNSYSNIPSDFNYSISDMLLHPPYRIIEIMTFVLDLSLILVVFGYKLIFIFNKYIQPDGCIVKAPLGAFITITVYKVQTIYSCKLGTVYILY